MSLQSSTWGALQYLNENAEKLLIYVLYVYLVLIVVTNVFTRYLLSTSPLWSTESARFIYIYLSWIGVSWTAYKRQHIRLDIVHRFLPERIVGATYVIGDVVMIAFVYYTLTSLWGPIQTTLELGNTTQALGINRVFILFAIPLGSGLLLLRTVQLLVRDVKDVWNDRPVHQGESLIESE